MTDLKKGLFAISEALLAQRASFKTLLDSLDDGADKDDLACIAITVEGARLKLLMLIQGAPVLN